MKEESKATRERAYVTQIAKVRKRRRRLMAQVRRDGETDSC